MSVYKWIENALAASDGGSLGLGLERSEGGIESLGLNRSIASRGTAAFNRVVSDQGTLTPGQCGEFALELERLLDELSPENPSAVVASEFVAALKLQSSAQHSV
jgi:hypothetical protein